MITSKDGNIAAVVENSNRDVVYLICDLAKHEFWPGPGYRWTARADGILQRLQEDIPDRPLVSIHRIDASHDKLRIHP